jgi:hypothetical protein
MNSVRRTPAPDATRMLGAASGVGFARLSCNIWEGWSGVADGKALPVDLIFCSFSTELGGVPGHAQSSAAVPKKSSPYLDT